MEERKVDLSVTAFNTTLEGNLEFENGKAKNLDTKRFEQIVLEEYFVHKPKRDKNRSVSDIHKNGSEDKVK